MQPLKLSQSVLRAFSPLDELSAANLAMLESRAKLFTYRKGEILFKDDASRGQVFYLLSGTVELHVQDELASTVHANTPRSRFPLKHGNSLRCAARVTSGQAECLCIDAKLLDKVLTWDQTGSYMVSELRPAGQDERTAGDWMVRLLQAPLLHSLPPAHLQSLFARMQPIQLLAGETVLSQGQNPDYVYIVATGNYRVTRRAAIGDGEMMLAELGPGDMFGEDALVGETRRNATVTAVHGGTIMRLGKADFDSLCKEPALREVDRHEVDRLVSEGGQVIDVRFASEAPAISFPGAINVPLHMLRQSIGTLRAVPTVVCCDQGQRSSVGAFILAQHGFEAFVLRTSDGAAAG